MISVRCTGCGATFRRDKSNTHTCPYCRREVVQMDSFDELVEMRKKWKEQRDGRVSAD